ncbi:hypothetical protein KFK09_003989 [Dendrobium nobile]|uniref:Transmembrane protein n=1 Tax=Dendrobium nobile TaxID=94219 RepID=A0A8T3BZ45_DENNO|nr:hypothetical protein KFK09_003989 [Dendrobium nobile]
MDKELQRLMMVCWSAIVADSMRILKGKRIFLLLVDWYIYVGFDTFFNVENHD